jgi:hypothetical protein
MDALDPNVSLSNTARALLRSYMNDPNGNGIEPLLRSQTFLSDLPGFQWGQITDMKQYVLQNEAGAADLLAVAMYVYTIHGQVRIWA